MLPYFSAPTENAETDIDRTLKAILKDKVDPKIDRLIEIL